VPARGWPAYREAYDIRAGEGRYDLTKEYCKRIATAVIVILANLLVDIYRIRHLDVSTRTGVQFVPDDAYYYLTLARNFVHQDSGLLLRRQALPAGSTLLHAYALAAVFFHNPRISGAVR